MEGFIEENFLNIFQGGLVNIGKLNPIKYVCKDASIGDTDRKEISKIYKNGFFSTTPTK